MMRVASYIATLLTVITYNIYSTANFTIYTTIYITALLPSISIKFSSFTRFFIKYFDSTGF